MRPVKVLPYLNAPVAGTWQEHPCQSHYKPTPGRPAIFPSNHLSMPSVSKGSTLRRSVCRSLGSNPQPSQANALLLNHLGRYTVKPAIRKYSGPDDMCLLNPLNAGYFSKNRLYCRLLFKTFKFCMFFMGNDRLSGKQVGSQASRRVFRRLAWIQPVCISINAVPALKGLNPIVHLGCLFGPYISEHNQIFTSVIRIQGCKNENHFHWNDH